MGLKTYRETIGEMSSTGFAILIISDEQKSGWLLNQDNTLLSVCKDVSSHAKLVMDERDLNIGDRIVYVSIYSDGRTCASFVCDVVKTNDVKDIHFRGNSQEWPELKVNDVVDHWLDLPKPNRVMSYEESLITFLSGITNDSGFKVLISDEVPIVARRLIDEGWTAGE